MTNNEVFKEELLIVIEYFSDLRFAIKRTIRYKRYKRDQALMNLVNDPFEFPACRKIVSVQTISSGVTK